jgi:glycerol-3-phosphate acyltransferase PlsY
MAEIIILVGVVLLGSYLIGSIPTGYLIVKGITGQDIREIGSGSTGATNVKRVLGKKWFFTVMILDAIKGAFPVVLASMYINKFSGIGLFPVLAAVAVIIGHSKPVFLQFKGGKSVASGVGTILALNWQVGLIIALVWAVVTYFSKFVSLGSIIALLVSPFIMHFYGHAPIAYVAYCALGAVYITYLHRQNIVRLIKGEENKVRE